MRSANGTGEKNFDGGFQDSTQKNNHPTVKPTNLMRYLVRLVTPKNGIVLDCFMGSGSTGKACALEGFEFVGIDLDKDYCKIAKARIDKALEDKKQDEAQKELF
jgi:site-specific DNA-methyltransferase (adenine-specific)